MNCYLGKRFNKLVVIADEAKCQRIGSRNVRYGIARCDCGIEKKYNLYELCRGKPISCGCYWQRTFESFLAPADDQGCRIWTGGSLKSNGHESHRYGRYFAAGRRTLAHRHAYTLVFGAIPAGMHVLHRCDVTLCCNPGHLFLGTHLDNMQDMVAKGRGNPRGEKNRLAKLTDNQAREVVRRRLAGEGIQRLADEFGISNSHVSRIARGLCRKELTVRQIEGRK